MRRLLAFLLLLGLAGQLPAANRADTFNRGDDASSPGTPSDGGSAWVVHSGTWGISSNTGYCAAAASPAGMVLESFTLSTATGNSGHRIRATDGSNYIDTVILNGYQDFSKYEAGSRTILDDSASALSNGDVMRVRANGTSLKLYRNDVEIISVTSSFNQTATKHGLSAFNSTGPRFDTFSITSLAEFTIDKTNVLTGSGTVVLTLTGVGTSWTGTPFSLTGTPPSGWSIASQNVASGTSATVTLNRGSGTGTITVSDGTLTDTVTATVTATSAATGNWSAGATWDGGSAPTSGNRAIVSSGHTVTVTASDEIGDSPADTTTWVLDGAGTLTVNAGVTLTVNGNARLRTFNGGDSTTGGGALEFDTTANDTAYVLQLGTANNQTTNRFTTRGTAGSRFEVRTVSGATAYAVIDCLLESGFFDCEDTTFRRLGDDTADGIDLQNQTSDYDHEFRRVTFTDCGRLDWGTSVAEDGGWVFEDVLFTSPPASATVGPLRLLTSATKAAGTTRTMTRVVFDCDLGPIVEVLSNTISNCVFRNGFDGTQAYTSITDSVIYFDDGTIARSGSPLYGGMTDSYVCANSDHALGNAHMILPRATATVSGVVWDSTMVGGEDTSDLLYTSEDIDLTITNNVIVTDPVTNSGAGVLNPNNPARFLVRHNTASVTGAGFIAVGDLNLDPDAVAEYKSNLVWSTGGTGSPTGYHVNYVHNVADPAGAGFPDVLDGTDATHNARYGLLAGQDLKGYNTDCTVAPGSNDVSLDASGGPQFVDDTRNMGRWAITRGYSAEAFNTDASKRAAYGDAWDALVSDPTRATDLVEWVTLGFAPTNTDLEDAGHDGVTIGAVEYQAVATGNRRRRLLLTGA
jgi:hypothetical protein